MANPNIVNVTSITGHTKRQVATTSAGVILSNPAASGKVIKINAIYAANVDASNEVDASIYWKDDTGAYGYLAYLIPVPSNSTLVVTSKETSWYLQENCDLRIQASASNDLNVTVSYEEIS